MRENRVKRTLREGGVALGTMVFEFASTGIARIAAAAGAEFVIFDMEHTGWSVETVRMLLATARAAELVPMVESEEQACTIVRSAKYTPLGGRGAAFGMAHDDYLPGDAIAKMASANEEGLLIAQIETARGIENVDAIAAVEGIDVLWIGHNDLSNSLGIPGQFEHPDYLRAIERFFAACERHGKAPGIMATSVEGARAQLAQGFRCLAYSGDIALYYQALNQGLAAIKDGSTGPTSGQPAR